MEDGAKRKLPSWMSRAVITSNTVGQSEAEKGVNIDNDLKDDIAFKSLHPKLKTKANPLKKDTCTTNESSDYEPKKRKRKKLNQVTEEESSVKNGSSGGRKIKNKKKERRRETSEEIESLSPIEDDGELTVEDLVTIAQEFVRRDESLGKQQLSNEFHEGKINSAIASSVHDLAALHHVLPRSNKETPMPKEIISNYNPIARIGDPAQDMLDLFLGPLLKKPVPEDKMVKNIEEDKKLVREVKEQIHDNNNVLLHFVPLAKKKSSLKDKVAMFF